MLFNLLFFVIFHNILTFGIINIPFSKKPSKNFIESIFNIDIITNITLGNPPQKLQITLSFLGESSLIKGSLFNSDYDERKSTKIKYYNKKGNSFYYDQYYSTIICSDELIFDNFTQSNSNFKKIKLEQYNFQLLNSTSIGNRIHTGIFGFKIIVFDSQNDNFVNQLYLYHLINNKIFSINYLNSSFGYFSFGNYPHVYDNETYDEKYYVKCYNEYVGRWGINFDRISLGNQTLYIIDKIIGKINLSIKGMIGDRYLKWGLNDFFFTEKFKNNECFSEDYFFNKQNITIYKCKSSFNLKSFPKIYLYQKDMNYSFELDSNELFIKDEDNNYLFLISFFPDHTGNWELGEIFLKKYQIIIEYSTKNIGFYTKKREKTKLNIKKYFPYLLFFIMAMLIIILSICLYKAQTKKRRIRANELEDNYDYFPQENKDEKDKVFGF